MRVTQQDIAGVLAYLLAAQAITATDGQVVVWHDYLTHTVAGLDACELRPACRDAVRAWATDGGGPDALRGGGAGARRGVRPGRVDPRRARQ